MRADRQRGLLDTNILIHGARLPLVSLPREAAISAVTLAELAAGVHAVRGADQRAAAERAARLALLQRAEHEFDALPFDARAAREFGALFAAVGSSGRSPRSRTADLMIAAIAGANGLPLFTTDADDFAGLGAALEVVEVPRPA